MSTWSWQDGFQATASRLKPADRPLRLAIVGLGHELRGDDAAGLAWLRALRQQLGPVAASGVAVSGANDRSLLFIEAGPAPENFCGLLRRFRPDLVLLVDAADLGAEPGTFGWLLWQAGAAIPRQVTSHGLPLSLLADYLTRELGCALALLGIQPAALTAGAPLSPGVKAAVAQAAQSMAFLLSEQQGVRSL